MFLYDPFIVFFGPCREFAFENSHQVRSVADAGIVVIQVAPDFKLCIRVIFLSKTIETVLFSVFMRVWLGTLLNDMLDKCQAIDEIFLDYNLIVRMWVVISTTQVDAADG